MLLLFHIRRIKSVRCLEFPSVNGNGKRGTAPSKVRRSTIAAMTDERMFRRLGELLGWEYLESNGPLPVPSESLEEALAGKRRPIFWSQFTPEVTLFMVAEPGERAVRWNPIENAEQRDRVLKAVEAAGGKVLVWDNSITVQRIDGERISSGDRSPRRICEAALEALSTEPIDG